MSTQLKRLALFALLASFLASCATAQAATPPPTASPNPTAGDNSFAPQPGDSALAVDTVEFVSAETLAIQTSPEQIQLKISYRLPTPCHQTRVVIGSPDANGRINVKMYSLMKKDTPCALMALATPLEATLNLGNFPAGHYTVYVNDTKSVEFDTK